MTNNAGFLDSLLDDDCMKVDASTKYRVPTSSRGGGFKGGRGGRGGYRATPQDSPQSNKDGNENYVPSRGGRGASRRRAVSRDSLQTTPLPNSDGYRNNDKNASRHTTPTPSSSNSPNYPQLKSTSQVHSSSKTIEASKNQKLSNTALEQQPRQNQNQATQNGNVTFQRPRKNQPISMTEEERSMMQRRANRKDNKSDTANTGVTACTPESSPELLKRTSRPTTPEQSLGTVSPGEEEPMKRIKGRSQLRKSLVDDPTETLRREMINNLNKLTVENFTKITTTICQIIASVDTKSNLEMACRLILDKAISEISSVEIYVDLMHIVSTVAPAFDSDTGNVLANSSGSDEAFKQFKELTGALGNEFAGRIPPVIELTPEQLKLSAEERGETLLKTRMNVTGIVKALTALMIRTLLKPSFWKNLMRRLTFSPDNNTSPADHLIEAACESIKVCGLYLDTIQKENEKIKAEDPESPDTPEYKHFQVACKHLTQTILRFEVLIELDDVPARVECIIRDILDAKAHKWYHKTHREKAKGLADIREDHKRSNIVGGAHMAAQYGTVEQMGARANLLNEDYKQYYLSKTSNYGFTITASSSSPFQ